MCIGNAILSDKRPDFVLFGCDSETIEYIYDQDSVTLK